MALLNNSQWLHSIIYIIAKIYRDNLFNDDIVADWKSKFLTVS